MAKHQGLKQRFQASARSSRSNRRSNRNGVILILACFCLPMLMALMGLAVDSGVLYSLKTKLQMSVDGAAIAGIRAVSLDQSVGGQQSYVDGVATHFFWANFVNGYLGTSNTVLTTPALTAPSGAQTVTVIARTDVPSYFMKYFNRDVTTITATGVATRQAANIMMVLDRSGSMAGSPCSQMITAAKQFTGIFTPGFDRIGLVTFAEAASIQSAPTTAFQTTLGYSNAGGSGNGQLDQIVCSGGTNTSAAISLGWNELYKASLPGANNFILLFTDGEPTAATFDLKGVINISSQCMDSRGYGANGKQYINNAYVYTGNFANFNTYPANWTGSDSNATNNGNRIIDLGTNSYWSPLTGMIAAIYSDGASLYGADPWFVPSGTAVSLQENKEKSAAETPGCVFNSTSSPVSDISGYPATDVFGMSTSGYKGSSTTLSSANGKLVNFNLSDNAAAWARRESAASQTVSYAGTSTPMPAITMHVIGLGSNGGVDTELLQRIANNPQNSTGPQGNYFYAPTASQLSAAFYSMGSNVMRLSQ